MGIWTAGVRGLRGQNLAVCLNTGQERKKAISPPVSLPPKGGGYIRLSWLSDTCHEDPLLPPRPLSPDSPKSLVFSIGLPTELTYTDSMC